MEADGGELWGAVVRAAVRAHQAGHACDSDNVSMIVRQHIP